MLTTTEAAKLLYTIRIAYPQAYSRATNEDLTAAAQLWARMLEDYTYQQASAGLMAYMEAAGGADDRRRGVGDGTAGAPQQQLPRGGGV